MNLNLTWSRRWRPASPRRRRRDHMRVYVSPERAAAVSRQCPFHTGDVMYTFPFALPPFYVAIIRCLGVLEGVAIQVDPGFRIVNDAYPYVAARLLTDEAPELRRALTNLLFKDQKPQWRRFEALLNRASSSSEYDASAVAAYLITALTEESAGPLREKLVDDLADALDYLGVGVALDVASAAGLDLPEPPDFLNGHQEGEAPPAAAALLAARDFLLGDGEGGDVDIGSVTRAARKVQPVAQSLYDAPSLRAALIEVLARASERAASRAIRLALKAATDPGALRVEEVEEEAPAPDYPFGYS